MNAREEEGRSRGKQIELRDGHLGGRISSKGLCWLRWSTWNSECLGHCAVRISKDYGLRDL